MLRVVPERVRADRERLRVRRHEADGRAGREGAAARAKDFVELAGKDVLGEMPRVEAVHAAGLDLPQVRERIDLVRLEPLLARLRDHARIEVDAVPADALVLQELQKDAAARPEIEHALAALVKIHEGLGLLADDRLVAAEARLEVDRVEVRGDLVLAPLLPLALQALEPRTEARRHLPLVVVRSGEKPVDALLPLEDRAHPPADERDDDLPRVGDDGTNQGFAAARVVLDLLVERLGERGERVLQVVGEDPPPAGQRNTHEGLDIGPVDALLTFDADALTYFCHERIEIYRLLLPHLAADYRGRWSGLLASRSVQVRLASAATP